LAPPREATQAGVGEEGAEFIGTNAQEEKTGGLAGQGMKDP
jgi:hypothetical protein